MKDENLYLEDIIERISMIEEFTVEGRETFMNSIKTQEAVIRCFEVIGEAIKRLAPDSLIPYPHIPWKQLAGFRDFLIHNYDKVNLQIVWQAVEDDLEPLKLAVKSMLGQADTQNEGDE